MRFPFLYRFCCLICTALLWGTALSAQEEWKLKTQREGIDVFTRNVADSKIKAIRIKCSINATLSQLVAVILDIDASGEWVPGTKSAVLLQQTSSTELFYYSEIRFPWPASNRDYVAHLTVSQDPHSRVVTIQSTNLPDHVPVKKGIVRVLRATGKWTIIPKEKNRMDVEYELLADPGGSIPAWVVNLLSTKSPLEAFTKLRLQVQKPAYKNAKLSFLQE